MNQWILLQLLVDIALFVLVAILVMKNGSFSGDKTDNSAEPDTNSQGVDIAQLETLMDELARLVLRAEKVADRIDKGLGAKPDRPPAPPARKPGTQKTYTKKNNATGKDDVYTDALKLIGEGLPDGEISEIVGLPAHEISLIRNIST